MEGERAQTVAVGSDASLLVQVEEQFGVADHRVTGTELGILVLDDVEAVGAAGENCLGFVPIENLDVLLNQHLGQVLVAGPSGHVAVAGLLRTQDSEIDPGTLKHPGHGLGDLLAAVVEGTGAANVKEIFEFRTVVCNRYIEFLRPIGAFCPADAPGIAIGLHTLKKLG